MIVFCTYKPYGFLLIKMYNLFCSALFIEIKTDISELSNLKAACNISCRTDLSMPTYTGRRSEF